jgi:hypothetical protein
MLYLKEPNEAAEKPILNARRGILQVGFDVPVDIVVLMRCKPPRRFAERLLAS